MAGSNDWWAQRLGGAPAAQPTAGRVSGVPLYPGQGQQPQYASPAQQQTPMLPGQGVMAQPSQQQFYTYNEQGQMVPDDGHVALLNNAAAMTGGSRAAQAGSGRCPECNGPNYFARDTTENGMKMRTPASPHCWDCGFPIIQSGSQHGGANMASRRGGGPAKRAKQLRPGHQVTNVDPSTGQTIVFPVAG